MYLSDHKAPVRKKESKMSHTHEWKSRRDEVIQARKERASKILSSKGIEILSETKYSLTFLFVLVHSVAEIDIFFICFLWGSAILLSYCYHKI